MSRLTETDSQGNWALSGVAWKSLYAGQIITDGMWEKIYGALWKLGVREYWIQSRSDQ